MSKGPRRRAPGERAGLAREVVLVAARALSAREGVAGLTMRGLARRLGVAPNALYSHFADKGALVDALVDSLLAGIELPPPAARDWRRALFHLMSESRRLLVAHADLIPHLLARPERGPNAVRLGDAILALLGQGGLHGKAAVGGMQVLLVYLMGFAALAGHPTRGTFELGLRWLIDGIARRPRRRAAGAEGRSRHLSSIGSRGKTAERPTGTGRPVR